MLIQPFLFDPARAERASTLDAHVWNPQAETRALVVDKADFNKRRWHALPACFGFHYGNAWEEADGTVRLDHCLATDPGIVTETLRYVMKGEFRSSAPLRYAQIVLPPKGDGRIVSRGEEAEFARVAPAAVGRRHRYVYTLGAPADPHDWHFRTVVKRDLESGAAESFDYEPGKIPEEHIFVPKPGGRREDDGCLIGTVLDWRNGVTGLSVFDARAVPAGPVAQAWLPYPLPLGFHGAFGLKLTRGVQSSAEVGDRVVERRLRRRHRAAHVEIAVDQPGVVALDDGHACRFELVGIGNAFVLQRIEAGGVDSGRRQAGKIPVAQRRHPRIGSVGIAGITVAEPGHVRLFQQIAVGVCLARRKAAHHVGRRIDQQLEARHGQARRARLVAQDGREVAAGAVASDRDARRIGSRSRPPGRAAYPTPA